MSRHLISKEALECMWDDHYGNFIKEREKTMKAKISEILGVKQQVILV
jgi:hypothetical protein